MIGADAPLSIEDVIACAPASTEEALDDAVRALADSDIERIGPSLGRLAAQGANATSLCIAATRHFRALHQVTSHPGGPDQGLSALRPPVFGPRRDAMSRQARHWGRTDLQLRSGSTYPAMPLIERAFIRIAMRGRARR